MTNLAIIIPLHEYNKEVEPLLNNAIQSVKYNATDGYEIRISCPNEIAENVKKAYKKYKDVFIYESEKSDFCSLVTNAINDSNWFSILEYDDEYSSIWAESFKQYADSYPDVSVFMMLEDLVDFNDKKFISMGNEAPWASSFSNDLGYIDHDCLQHFFDFYMTGSIFKTEDWKEIGGLKSSIKLSFWYEFLLRATYKGKKIYVIPKVGYIHYLGRKGSLIEKYKETIDEKESNWWINLAKREFYFSEDRNKLYDPSKTFDGQLPTS